MLHLVERLTASGNLKSEISNPRSELAAIRGLAESCSRQLRAWADSLQNGDIKGQRHLTDRSRAAYDRERRAAAYWEKIDAMHAERMAAQALQRDNG